VASAHFTYLSVYVLRSPVVVLLPADVAVQLLRRSTFVFPPAAKKPDSVHPTDAPKLPKLCCKKIANFEL